VSKVRLNITVSEEVRDMLGDSPSRAVEELVLGKQASKDPVLNEIKFQADRIISELKSKDGFVKLGNPP